MRLIFLLISLVASLCAEIIQINRIDECVAHLQEDTLVIFDLDNTIMEPVQTLGSDQWFPYQLNEFKKQGYSDREAFDKIISAYVAIQNVTKMKLVEPTSADLLKSLQRKYIPVMGLTSRSLVLISRTIDQLNSIGVDFSKTSPVAQEINFDHDPKIAFHAGILFSSGTNKGVALRKMLKASGYQPQYILFVDDRLNHLQDVESVCQDLKIPFLGLRYGFLDEKVKRFCGELANKQFECFGQVLSDEDAEALLKTAKK